MSVTVKSIYDQALAILGESPDPDGVHKFADRSGYLCATFCANTAEIDRDFRESHALEPQPEFSDIYLEPESEFPLCDRFAAPASHYIAAMLVLGENEALSDSIFDKYCDALTRAIGEIPFQKGRIRNVYY